MEAQGPGAFSYRHREDALPGNAWLWNRFNRIWFQWCLLIFYFFFFFFFSCLRVCVGEKSNGFASEQSAIISSKSTTWLQKHQVFSAAVHISSHADLSVQIVFFCFVFFANFCCLYCSWVYFCGLLFLLMGIIFISGSPHQGQRLSLGWNRNIHKVLVFLPSLLFTFCCLSCTAPTFFLVLVPVCHCVMTADKSTTGPSFQTFTHP